MVFADSTRSRRGAVLVAIAAGCLGLGGLESAVGQGVLTAASRQVDQLIGQLDHPDFAARGRAAARLRELAEKRGLQTFLSRRFQRALLSGETSFEARSNLESLARELPPPSHAGPQPSAAQIMPLLDQLSSDLYARRDSASRQLEAMLAHPELIAPLWLELKRRTADLQLAASDRRVLEPLCERAREAWLLVGPDRVPLPQPSPAEISRWIDDLSQPDESVADGRRRLDLARRELLDLIVRQDTQHRVLDTLKRRIADLDEAARGPLQELVDLAKPGMAAEVWLNHDLRTVQYLIIDLPQYNDSATGRKATHFDRIDDQTAHCVSGNSLNPGDYPVRVAIPHPQPGQETMFFLTNLPTPRRRLAYEYGLRRDEGLRLQEITERTANYFLNRQTSLDEGEVLLLARLDWRGVSRFVGPYFETVPNTPLISALNGVTSQPTVHSAISAVLSQIGTHEAVPALERLARSGALGKLTYENRLSVAWIATLAIARRDPWPGIDDWLAGLVDEDLPLTADPDGAPDLGASAAGLLLDRQGASTGPFGLHTAGESLTDSFRFIGYRFSSPGDRQDVLRWWRKQKKLAAAGRAAGLTGNDSQAPAAIHLGPAERRNRQRK